MFVDEVTITVKGGQGGNGMKSFRREKYVPFGGPDGGDGGNGGEVIFQSERNLDTLSDFRGRKTFPASDGVPGSIKKLKGRTGKSLILKVPVGTIIYDTTTKEVIHDFQQEGQQYMAVRGGRGGYGNAHFVSSIRQAPRFAELGDRGEERTVRLTLKLIADVGIIGFPNAGKSTLISHISNAKPKIANYPFTTLIPNLGIVDHKQKSFVVADTPGLIEGASKGKGLGIQFLKHIERTKTLLYLIDGYEENPYQIYTKIKKELERYNKELLKKPQVIAINKIDALDEDQQKTLEKKFKRYVSDPLFFISAVTGKEIGNLLDNMITMLETNKQEEPQQPTEEIKVFRPHLEDPKYFEITKKRNVFIITGKRIEQIVRMSPLGNREALERVYDVMKKTKIYNELLKKGAKDGNTILIGKAKIIFRE